MPKPTIKRAIEITLNEYARSASRAIADSKLAYGANRLAEYHKAHRRAIIEEAKRDALIETSKRCGFKVAYDESTDTYTLT